MPRPAIAFVLAVCLTGGVTPNTAQLGLRAELFPALIDAVACIAGPCGTAAGGGPRRLIVAGSLDPLAPPARLRPSVDTKAPLVSYREAPDWGHALLVAHVLDDVVRWLLEEPVPPPTPRSSP